MTTNAESARQVHELLPFWVNGTLSGDERSLVGEAVEADDGLDRQAQILAQIRTSMQEAEGPAAPGEFVLARLHRSIRDEGTARRTPWVSHALTAGLAAVATYLLVALVPRSDTADGYSLASSNGATITIALRDGARTEQVTSFLIGNGLTITHGPTALGFYHLTLSEMEMLDEVLATLTASGSPVEVIDYPQ